MYSRKNGLYFGTPGNMRWLPAPKQGILRTPNRFISETEYLNGSSSLYQSYTGSMRYEMDFGFQHPEDIQHLIICDQGAYGGEVFFLDPFAAKTNVLPSYWASPWLSAVGAPNLQGVDSWNALMVGDTPANTLGYPLLMGRFGEHLPTQTWDEANAPELWIPVPDGFTFHMGVHGVNVTPDMFVTVAPDGDTPDDLTMMAVTDSALTNYTYTPTGGNGVTIALTGDSDAAIDIAGMVAQVLPTGQSAPTGRFIPGTGHSGCRIVGGVQNLGHSVVWNWEQYSIAMREYGNWVTSD